MNNRKIKKAKKTIAAKAKKKSKPVAARVAASVKPVAIKKTLAPSKPAPTPPSRAPVRKIIGTSSVRPVVISGNATHSSKNESAFAPELRAALDRIKTHPNSSKLHSQALKDYCNEGESLPAILNEISFGKLLEVNVDQMCARFGLDDASLRTLIEVLHRACRDSEPHIAPPKTVKERIALNISNGNSSGPEKNDTFPILIRAFLSLAAEQCQFAKSSPFSLARLMSVLPETLGADELAVLALGVDFEPSLIATFLKQDIAWVLSTQERATIRLNEKFSELCQDVQRQWEIVLQGSGVSENSLIERYLVNGLDKRFQTVLGRILLRAMGAKHPLQNGTPQRDKWSTNPESIAVAQAAAM